MTETNPLIEEARQQAIDYTAQRDARIVPLVKDIFNRIGNAQDLSMGSTGVTEESINDYYSEFVQNNVLPLLMTANVKLSDVSYIFKLLLQVIGFIEGKVKMTIDLREEQANEHLWRVKDVGDITVGMVQDILVDRDAVNKPVDSTSIAGGEVQA